MTIGRPNPTPVPLPRFRSLPPRVAVPAALAVGLVVIGSACSGAEPIDRVGSFHPDGWEGVIDTPPDDLFDPVAAGEPPPPGSFRQLLGRDDIAPVYIPRFVEAVDAEWEAEELVIGVDLDGEARAYPVSFLNRREIVVDLHRGVPTFVTW